MPEPVDEVRLVKVLLDLHLFGDLDYTQVSSIISRARQRVVPAGEVLCESRTIDERLIVLLEGSLRLESAEGEAVSTLNPVRIIGEMGVFTGQTRSSRVVSEGEATVLELDADDLQDLLEEDPQMGNHMLASLIKLLYSRVHDANEEVASLNSHVKRLRSRLEAVSPGDALLEELFPEDSQDGASE